jgi:hypothetical protein
MITADRITERGWFTSEAEPLVQIFRLLAGSDGSRGEGGGSDEKKR